MEDLMIHMNYTEIMHVEADNLLFGQLTRYLYFMPLLLLLAYTKYVS